MILTMKSSRKENLIIALGRLAGPLFGNETPLVELARIHFALLLYVVGEVVAQVKVGSKHDALGQLVVRDAGTLCKQFTAAVSAIGVQCHAIGAAGYNNIPYANQV